MRKLDFCLLHFGNLCPSNFEVTCLSNQMMGDSFILSLVVLGLPIFMVFSGQLANLEQIQRLGKVSGVVHLCFLPLILGRQAMLLISMTRNKSKVSSKAAMPWGFLSARGHGLEERWHGLTAPFMSFILRLSECLGEKLGEKGEHVGLQQLPWNQNLPLFE